MNSEADKTLEAANLVDRRGCAEEHSFLELGCVSTDTQGGAIGPAFDGGTFVGFFG